MSTGLEREFCFGPIHNGVETVLASQIEDKARKWCFRCLARERMEKGQPQISQNARKPGAMRARIDGEFKGSQAGKILNTEGAKVTERRREDVKMEQKTCGYCHKPKPVSEFDESTRFPGKLQATCRGCKDKVKKSRPSRALGAAKIKPEKPPAVAKAMAGTQGVDGALARVLGHSHQLLSIALLGPREQDNDFLRALCAAILNDTLIEAKVPVLGQPTMNHG